MPTSRPRLENDVIIVGGGISGLTAAWHATHHGLSATLLEPSGLFGGQVATINAIEGYATPVQTSGADLAASILNAARKSGVAVVEEFARTISVSRGRIEVMTDEQRLKSRSLILATGARLRMLDVPDAENLVGRGISQCASCDGPLFRDRDVVVVGGGDAALQGAFLLAPICRSVHIVVRNHLRARRGYIERVKSLSNVKFIWDHIVDSVLGGQNVNGIRLRNQENGEVIELSCDGIFPLIGTIPNTEFLPESIKRDESGLIVTMKHFLTSASGVYAVGAARAGYSGELLSAAAEGAAVIKDLASTLD